METEDIETMKKLSLGIILAFATLAPAQDLAHWTVKAVKHPVHRSARGIKAVGKYTVVPVFKAFKFVLW